MAKDERSEEKKQFGLALASAEPMKEVARAIDSSPPKNIVSSMKFNVYFQTTKQGK